MKALFDAEQQLRVDVRFAVDAFEALSKQRPTDAILASFQMIASNGAKLIRQACGLLRIFRDDAHTAASTSPAVAVVSTWDGAPALTSRAVADAATAAASGVSPQFEMYHASRMDGDLAMDTTDTESDMLRPSGSVMHPSIGSSNKYDHKTNWMLPAPASLLTASAVKPSTPDPPSPSPSSLSSASSVSSSIGQGPGSDPKRVYLISDGLGQTSTAVELLRSSMFDPCQHVPFASAEWVGFLSADLSVVRAFELYRDDEDRPIECHHRDGSPTTVADAAKEPSHREYLVPTRWCVREAYQPYAHTLRHYNWTECHECWHSSTARAQKAAFVGKRIGCTRCPRSFHASGSECVRFSDTPLQGGGRWICSYCFAADSCDSLVSELIAADRLGVLTPTPSPELATHMQSHHWSVCRQEVAIRSLVENLMTDAFRKSLRDHSRHWGSLKVERQSRVKRSHQRELDSFPSVSAIMLDQLVQQVRQVLVKAGVPNASRLYCAVKKALRSRPGAGRQISHTDLPLTGDLHDPATRQPTGKSKASQCVAVILHLNVTPVPGTHVPKWTAEEMAGMTGANFKRHGAPICEDASFVSHLMEMGDLLLFFTDVAHYGPANSSRTEWRWILYFLFSPEEGPDQDHFQDYLHCR
jgi:hypothetical protein